MAHTSTATPSGDCGKGRHELSSVRPHLTAGVVLAAAGILASGLVAASPGPHGVRTEVRGVQLAAIAADLAAPNPTTSQESAAAAPWPAPIVIDPPSAQVDNIVIDPAVLEVLPVLPLLGSLAVIAGISTVTQTVFPEPLREIVSFFVAPTAAPIFLLGIAATVPWAFVVYQAENVIAAIFGQVPSAAVSAASPAHVEANAASVTSERPAESTDATVTSREAGAAPVVSTDSASDIKQADSTAPVTAKKPVSSDMAQPALHEPPAAELDEPSTRSTPAVAREPLVETPTSEPSAPSDLPSTARPVVRDSLKVGEQPGELTHSGSGGDPATPSGGDGVTTAVSASVASSSAASSTTAGGASSGDSSSGDAGGS